MGRYVVAEPRHQAARHPVPAPPTSKPPFGGLPRGKRASWYSGPHGASVAKWTERCVAEFAPRLSLTTIIATVQECRRELDGAPPCPSSSSGSRGSGEASPPGAA